MKNVIAVVWDFDKTLVDGYMQDPIFDAYGIKGDPFWDEVNELGARYFMDQEVKINRETIYLNHFINHAKNDGYFAKGKATKESEITSPLNNAVLRKLGAKIKFYKGVEEIFKSTQKLFDDNKEFSGYGFSVEHYIVSTGFAEMIKGSVVAPYVKDIWGCELIQSKTQDDEWIISEIGYTIDNTSKTRALFEINKGANIKEWNIDVNSSIPEKSRRIPFSNIIYIADGPSDIPAFSVVKKGGGYTLGVYKLNPEKVDEPDYEAPFKQAKILRDSNRIDMMAEADYREGTTANLWIKHQILDIARKVKREIEDEINKNTSKPLKHLT